MNRDVVAEYRSVVADDEANSDSLEAADPLPTPDAGLSIPRGWTTPPEISAVVGAIVDGTPPRVMKSNGGGTPAAMIPLRSTAV